jgi:hypothetical protein
MPVKTHIPKKVTLAFGGVPIKGTIKGTYVNVEQSEDTWQDEQGTDGAVSRILSGDEMTDVTITIQQTSPSNDYLSGVYQADKRTGLGALPLVVKDNSGRSIFVSDQAWIKKPAPAAFADTLQPRAWVFRCATPQNFVGGNGTLFKNLYSPYQKGL